MLPSCSTAFVLLHLPQMMFNHPSQSSGRVNTQAGLPEGWTDGAYLPEALAPCLVGVPRRIAFCSEESVSSLPTLLHVSYRVQLSVSHPRRLGWPPFILPSCSDLCLPLCSPPLRSSTSEPGTETFQQHLCPRKKFLPFHCGQRLWPS